jgi:succinate dehydrogenase (ubiquinone) iron-sulfur subunit
LRNFGTTGAPGLDTKLSDVADILKVNYTVEYEQGLTDE